MIQNSSRLVTAQGVGVFRSGRWLVRDIDVAVHRGEIVTFIGPNGSGKTTTAKVLLGLMAPDEGLVERHGAMKVGYVPQKLSIDWSLPMKVERLMKLTGHIPGKDMDEALERVGAAHLKQSHVQPLSGGEFQRVMIARAIARKPDLLVLDEPVQGVDFNGEIELYDLIAGLRDDLDCGILMISHDLHVVMAKTDTVVCLNGHVCCRGTPGSVLGNPAYQSLFGSRAAETIALYKHDHDHTHDGDHIVPQEDVRNAG